MPHHSTRFCQNLFKEFATNINNSILPVNKQTWLKTWQRCKSVIIRISLLYIHQMLLLHLRFNYSEVYIYYENVIESVTGCCKCNVNILVIFRGGYSETQSVGMVLFSCRKVIHHRKTHSDCGRALSDALQSLNHPAETVDDNNNHN